MKLTDFGIIKLLEVTNSVPPSTGGIIGTPSYMAPEQADLSRKHEIGPASDIYALGVVAFELLTGRLPFKGANHQTILAAHATKPPPDPRDFNHYLTAPVAQVLLKVLAKQPIHRYPTAISFVEALEQTTLGSTPIRSRKASTTKPRTTSTTASTTVPATGPPFATALDGTAHPMRQTQEAQGKGSGSIFIDLALIIVMTWIIGYLVYALIFDTSQPAEPTVEQPNAEATAEPTPTVTEESALPLVTPQTPSATPVQLTVIAWPTATAVPPTATPMKPTATYDSSGITHDSYITTHAAPTATPILIVGSTIGTR